MTQGRDEPLVSVVVPVYNVAEFVAEALESVLSQQGVALDVVVVDDASSDGSDRIVEEIARRDPRVRLVRQEHGGLGAARNTGVRHARGEFLTFHDSDDVVPPGAYAAHVESLLRTGSDFSIGCLERFDTKRRWTLEWSREVHENGPHEHVTITELPVAMKDIIACNRVYRRSFWDSRVGQFPEGTAYEDHLPMLRSFLDGARFDVLPTTTYLWRRREDGSSISQQKGALDNLRDRLRAKEAAWDLLADASPVVRRAYASRVLDLDLSGFHPHAAGASEEYRRELSAASARYLERADAHALATVRTHRKVAAWLAAEQRWDALEWLESGGKRTLLEAAVEAEDGELYAVATQLEEILGHRVPTELLRLSEDQRVLEPVLVRTRWVADRHELDLRVELRGARDVPAPDHVELELAGPAGETRTVPAQSHEDCWRARLEVADLAPLDEDDETTRAVRVRVRWSTSVHVARVATVRRGSGAAYRRARPGASPFLVIPVLRARDGLELTTVPAVPRAVRLGFGRRGPRVELATTHSAWIVTARAPRERAVEARSSGELAMPETTSGEPWALRAQHEDGRALPVVWPADLDDPVVPRSGRLAWRWQLTPRGTVQLVARSALLEVTQVDVVGDDVVLEARLVDGWRTPPRSVRWSAGTGELAARRRKDRWTVTVPRAVLEDGPVRLAAHRGEEDLDVRLARSLLDEAPVTLLLAGHRVEVTAAPRATPRLELREPVPGAPLSPGG